MPLALANCSGEWAIGFDKARSSRENRQTKARLRGLPSTPDYLRRLRSAGEDLGEVLAGVGGTFGDAVLDVVGRAAERREVRLVGVLQVVRIDADALFERFGAGQALHQLELGLGVAEGKLGRVAADIGVGLDAVNDGGLERAREARRVLMIARQRFLGAAGAALDIFAGGGADLQGLKDRLERRDLGDVGIGHGWKPPKTETWSWRPDGGGIANVLLHCN